MQFQLPGQTTNALFTASGLRLPTLNFSSPGQSTQSNIKETSFFSKCKIQLKSPRESIGTKRDKHGVVTITSNPSTINFTIEKFGYSININEKRYKWEKLSAKSIKIMDSSKTTINIIFYRSTECISFIATLFLHKHKQQQNVADIILGDGHPINPKDDFKVLTTKWNLKTPTSLGGLISDQKEISKDELPYSEKEILNGAKTGGIRCYISTEKLFIYEITEVHEFRQRIRIAAIYPKFLEIENLCNELQKVAEATVKKQRIVHTTREMKRRLDELNASIAKNSITIERLKEEQMSAERKLEEIQKTKRRIDVDESQNQLEMVKEQLELKEIYNTTIEKEEELHLNMMHRRGECALLAKCIESAFAVMCAGLAERTDKQSVMEAIENAQRQIAESLYI
ncbi:hypothetical protein GPJ56_006648 [Histomonas meleagridis]|uniref:uncharacterized protein n=1 Tax=Histomonas meleagridis TaxID=135588 RepID=UPI0035597917|nr:hypothetical protein GPJ56_006648 [Histomonas meleagridis]KAH0803659.1 hypothetical protein GO595_003543 [Histomonas meleagridis]